MFKILTKNIIFATILLKSYFSLFLNFNNNTTNVVNYYKKKVFLKSLDFVCVVSFDLLFVKKIDLFIYIIHIQLQENACTIYGRPLILFKNDLFAQVIREMEGL